MKDFGKLVKLFNYENKNIFDLNAVTLLREKFKNIVKTYKIETCPNFIKDVAFFIFIIDQRFQGIRQFLENTVEKFIQSVQTVTDIYLYLSSNYKEISKDVIDCITSYFTRNRDKLKGESILFLLQKLNSPNIVKSFLNKIDNFVIKEEELFSQEKEIDSFKLLKEIEKEKLLDKFPQLNETKYLLSTINLGEKILNKIKNEEIKYNLFYSMWIGKKNLLKERLDILLFNNINDVEICMKEFEEIFKKIIKIINYIKKLSGFLKEFYIITHQNNIELLDKLEKTIKDRNLNEIEIGESKKTIEQIYQIFPDLDKKNKFRNSIFFVYLFHTKKNNNTIKKEDEIFNETEEEFKKLKSFFEKDWITKVDEGLLKECYKALKNVDDAKIKSELTFLKDYF